MKYLTFDVEIARDLDKIRFDEFEPDDGEEIEILLGDDWVKDTYKDHNLELCSSEAIPSAHFWHPVNNTDWKRFRPLGITCAAAASSDGGLWNWWANDRGKFTAKMSRHECVQMLLGLEALVEDGYTILTWNGLGFDFCILADESGLHEDCAEFSLDHIDMMFHFFASKGFPLGLDTASKGMGLPGKPEGMTGAIAPQLWANGEYHKVLDYVSWDARNSLGLAQAVDKAYCLEWTAKSGRRNTWHAEKWLTVKEAMASPEPDTDWMKDPWPRSKFYGWTGYEPEAQIVTGDHHKDADWDIDYDEMEEEERREIDEEGRGNPLTD